MDPLVIANYLLVFLMLVVLPVWILARSKFPRRVKVSLGFNYFALLVTLFLWLGSQAQLRFIGWACRSNLETLARGLQEEEPATVRAGLEEWLHSGRENPYRLEFSAGAGAEEAAASKK